MKHEVKLTLTVEYTYKFEVEADSKGAASDVVWENRMPSRSGIVNHEYLGQRAPRLGVEQAESFWSDVVDAKVEYLREIPKEEE